jgi:phenylpropionate dioxygenase-like ring-hydroxylating dioxygenase large terminal subunit
MLTQDKNDLLTQTDSGTPGGELMRRYWQPVALSQELPVGGAPVEVNIFGEELVLFRDDQNRVGLLDRHCSHRGTDLSYARVEDGGLRCLYHGWLYDINGRCLEQPAEPQGGLHRDSIHQTAYPVVERAGAFFAYMGPGEAPEFPAYDFLHFPAENMHSAKVFVDCNYLQANEGNYDPAHVGFLHRTLDTNRRSGLNFGDLKVVGNVDTGTANLDPHETPRLEVERTDFGLRIFQVRSGGPSKKYLRVTIFGMPNFSVIAGPQGGDGHIGIWHVPIDDHTHWRWHFYLRRDAPLGDDSRVKNPERYHAEHEEGFRLKRKKANRYMQDRSKLGETYTGMGANFNAQDAFATESQGAIQDRTREHLVTTDIAIAAARRIMLEAIEDVQAGKDPLGVVRNKDANDFVHLQSFDVLADSALDNREVVRQVINPSVAAE